VEEALDPARIITENDGPGAGFLLDYLTILIKNTEIQIMAIIENLARVRCVAQGAVIMVS
jgi:hypothetical protein